MISFGFLNLSAEDFTFFVFGLIELTFIIVTLFFHIVISPFCIKQILRNAVSKTHNRISDLRKEILSLKKNISSSEEAAKEAKAELDAAESKLTLVDGEPVIGDNPARLNRLKSHAEKTKEEVVSLQESLEAKEALLSRAIEENEVIDVKLVLVNCLQTILLIKHMFEVLVQCL